MARGKKTGGRQKGSRNKASVARERQVANSGLTPLDYMLQVMRNPRLPADRRDWAANASAPYVHPKLATLQSNVNLTGRLTLGDLVRMSMPQAANDPEGLIDVTPNAIEEK